MIVRVKIRKRNGSVLRQWALHRANDYDSLNELKKSLFDGSSGNECFPSIQPLQPPWLQLARTTAVCGMKMSDLMGTPMDFTLSEIHSGEHNQHLYVEFIIDEPLATPALPAPRPAEQPAEQQETVNLCDSDDDPQPSTSNQSEAAAKTWNFLDGYKQQHTPTHMNGTRADTKLYNVLIDVIRSFGSGWKIDEINSPNPKRFLVDLRNAVWYLDGHHETFQKANCPLPRLVTSKCSGFNKPENHGHVKKKLSAESLQVYVDSLSEYEHQGWMNRKSNAPLLKFVKQILAAMTKYVDQLLSRRQSDADRHASLEPVRNPAENLDMIILPKRSGSVFIPVHLRGLIQNVTAELDQLAEFEPLLLNLLLSDLKKKERHDFLKFIKEHGLLNTDAKKVCLYVYASGNNIGNTYFVWWEGADDMATNTNQRRAKMITDIATNIDTYHTRAMKKETNEMLSKFVSISPAQYRQVYKLLTGDQSVTENTISKNLDDRMKCMLEGADDEVIVDLRKNNGRKPSFDEFWDIVTKYLNDKTCVDERRHDEVSTDGDVIVHMALAMSLTDLYRQCCAIADEKNVNKPTYSWFRVQFWPNNPYQKTALQYTGKFKVKYQVQQRQLRKNHPDAQPPFLSI